MKRAYPDPLPLPYEMRLASTGEHAGFAALTFAVLGIEDQVGKLGQAIQQHGLPRRGTGALEQQVLTSKIYHLAHAYLNYRSGYHGLGSSYPRDKEAFHKCLDAISDQVME